MPISFPNVEFCQDTHAAAATTATPTPSAAAAACEAGGSRCKPI